MQFLLRLYFSLLVLAALGSCQQDHQRITLELDQTIVNSYHQALANTSSIRLSANETVVYDQGIWKISTRAADVRYGQTRFRISLADSNLDGRFNEPDNDIVILSIFGQEAIPIDIYEKHVGVLRATTIIQVDRYFFLLEDEKGDGKSLQLIPWERVGPESVTATLRTRMGQLPLKNLSNQETLLKFNQEDNSLEELLLFVWNPLDPDETILLDQLIKSPFASDEKRKVVALSMGEIDAAQRNIIATALPDIDHYIIMSRTCKILNCHAQTPYGIQLDKYCNIVNIHLLKEELKSFASQ